MSKFYVVDAETNENRGSVVIDPYDEASEDAYNNLVRSLIDANSEIVGLRADCKKLTNALFNAVASLTIAIDDYKGPYLNKLIENKDTLKEMCVEMYNYLVEKE